MTASKGLLQQRFEAALLVKSPLITQRLTPGYGGRVNAKTVFFKTPMPTGYGARYETIDVPMHTISCIE